MKKQFLLVLAFSFGIAQAHINSQATANLYTAIENADANAAYAAITQGADVNFVDMTTGYTPLMAAIAKDVELKVNIHSRNSVVVGFAIVGGLTGAITGGFTAKALMGNSIEAIIGAIVAAIGCGIICGKLANDLFAHLFNLRVMQKADRNLESIIRTLCDHPDINFDIKHDLSSKNVPMILAEIINPHWETVAIPSYTSHHVGSNNSIYHVTFQRPSTIEYHTNAEFSVMSTPYRVNEQCYQTIKPFFEKLARYLYHEKHIVIPSASNR